MTDTVKYLLVGISLLLLAGCTSNSTPLTQADTPQPGRTDISIENLVAGADVSAPATLSPVRSSTATAESVSPIPLATFAAEAPISPLLPAASPTVTVDSRRAVFVIVPETSKVTYAVNEILLAEGDRQISVSGNTNQISGQIELDYDDPSRSSFGALFVRVLSLRSDNPERDRSLSDQWPDISRFPFAMFTVTEVRGLPDTFQIGQPVQFQLVGMLSLKGVVHPETWDVSATLLGNQITGTATTTLSLTDYDIPVPNVPAVHQVMDSVTVTVDFTLQEAATLPEKPHT